jgi:multidrug efflux pump subunit AcrA (membrane-fusion protein)
MRKAPLLLLLPLLASLALAGCSKPKAKTTEAQQARAVRVVTLEPEPITGALTASGDLVSREEAAVLPEVSGFRVSKVLVDVGDTVRKGQTLPPASRTSTTPACSRRRPSTSAVSRRARRSPPPTPRPRR